MEHQLNNKLQPEKNYKELLLIMKILIMHSTENWLLTYNKPEQAEIIHLLQQTQKHLIGEEMILSKKETHQEEQIMVGLLPTTLTGI